MTNPRRRVIRPPACTVGNARQQAKIDKLRARLQKERTSQARWLSKLKRAFHAFEKQTMTIARLEKELSKLND